MGPIVYCILIVGLPRCLLPFDLCSWEDSEQNCLDLGCSLQHRSMAITLLRHVDITRIDQAAVSQLTVRDVKIAFNDGWIANESWSAVNRRY